MERHRRTGKGVSRHAQHFKVDRWIEAKVCAVAETESFELTGEVERWFLVDDGSDHEVVIRRTLAAKTVTWLVDDVVVARKETSDERIHLVPREFPRGGAHDEDRAISAALPLDLMKSYGAIRVQLPLLPGPARRVTRHTSQGTALVNTGGHDFAPEAGSKAAERELWIRTHPTQHAVRAGAAKAAAVLIPVSLILVTTQWVLPWLRRLLPDWNLPSIPWPDWNFPSIPWPDWDLPSLPLPDLPDLPGWLEPVFKFVVPVVVAVLIAVADVHRKRKRVATKTPTAKPPSAQQIPDPAHPDEDLGKTGGERREPQP